MNCLSNYKKNATRSAAGQRFTPKYFKPSLIALAILHCSPLLAATSDADNSASLMTITANADDDAAVEYGATQASTANKNNTPLNETPQSVSVVTRSMIEDYQVTSLDDAMKFVSGVTQGNTLGGTEDGFVKRGFGANSDGSILLDGVRSNQGLAFDSTIDHVEVLKGSASLLYGIQNPGGVINMISKKPQYQWNTRVSGRTGGSGGGSGTLDVTGPLGNGFAFRLIAERQSEDYWRNFGKNQHTLLAPSLSWFGEKASFNISYEEFKYDVPYDRGTAFINGKPLDIPYKERIDEAANHAWGKNKRLNTTWEYELGPDWKTRLSYAWMQRRYDSNEVRATAINTTTGAVTRRADANRGFNHQTSLTSWDWIGEPQVFAMTHDLLIGADYEKVETYKQYSYRGKVNSDFNMYDPVYQVAPITNSSTYSDSNSNLRSTIYNHSIYAKDSIHFTEHWIGVIGGRYQHVNQKGSQGFVTPLETQNYTVNKFLPQVGLVYKLNESLSFYGNVSKSFTPSTDVDDNGTTAQPELGTTYEVGSKWQITPRLDATLALYRIDEKDMSVYINGVTRNIPKARSSGIELEMNGEVAKDWNLSANYAYDKTEIVKDNVTPDNVGNRLVNAPTNMGSLYLSHTLRWVPVQGDIRLGGGARYVGKRAGDPENSFTMPAYTVADAFISWDNQLLGKHTQLQLNINNIFNKEYYTSSAGNLRVEEGETRNVVLSASVDF